MKRILAAIAIVTLLTAGAQAVPFQYSATLSNMPTSFDAATGTYSISGSRTLILFDKADGSEEAIENANFTFSTTLNQDFSNNGILDGYFTGGSFSFQDQNGVDLLSGTIEGFRLTELTGQPDSLAANGSLLLTGGQLFTSEIDPSAAIYNINFSLDPSDLDDFSTAFNSYSNITMTAAVPEPTTIALLGLGLAGIVVRRRKK